jgi:hypothetical protein
MPENASSFFSLSFRRFSATFALKSRLKS